MNFKEIIQTLSPGLVHSVPADVLEAILSPPDIRDFWENLTPIARNEWLCWIEDAKKTETRIKRIQRLREELPEGKKRPCCWPGCPHRSGGLTS